MARNPDVDLDVLIVGAGVSGVGALYYLRRAFPDWKIQIYEGRSEVSGTWSLFSYPGIRSDSDMYTYGFSFNPWKEKNAYGAGETIKNYVKATVNKFDMNNNIRLNAKISQCSWSTERKRWTVTLLNEKNEVETKTATFVMMCTGYYDYKEGYFPTFPEMESFQGRIIHPQHWPKDLDYKNKRVAIIGSGATAITLLPNMTPTATHVTMIQRSPSYISDVPGVDPIAKFLYSFLPVTIAYFLTRWYKIFFSAYLYYICLAKPEKVKKLLIGLIAKALPDVDVKKHFTPVYNPWQQRYCICPDGDFFKSLKEKKASIVTGHIKQFSKEGILMEDGEEVKADVVVVATGLKLLLFGGIQVDVDGKKIDQSNMMYYKGMLLQNIPNFVHVFGYLNASWTPRSDNVASYLVRLLKEMQRRGSTSFRVVYNPLLDKQAKIVPFHDGFSSNYLKRAEIETLWGTCATRYPWRNNLWILQDLWTLKFSNVADPEVIFSK